MTTIDPRASVLAALQARLSPSRAGSRAPMSASGGASAPAHTAGGTIARRLAAIDRADPDGRRKAVRIVLEAQLAREFGAGMLNDPGFAGLLDAVQQQMESDALTAAAVRALGEHLFPLPA